MSLDRVRPVAPLAASTADLGPAEANYHLLLTVFKWYRLILIFGLVLLLAAAAAMLLKRDVPFATAKILIKSEQDTISGFPTGRPASPDVLHTEAELLGSRVVLLPVARALLAERGDPVTDERLEAKVAELRDDLVVTLITGTTMLRARQSAPNGAEAQRMLQMILDSLVEQHASAYSGSSFSDFFQKETQRAAAQLQDAEDRLHRWQEANNIVAVEEELAAQLAAVGELEHGLKRTDVDIEVTRALIDTLQRDINALPAQAVTSRDRVANPLVARLKSDLAVEEAALGDRRRGPVAERLQMELAAAEVALREPGASPLATKLKSDLVTAQLALNDLRQRYQDEDRRVQEKLEQIARLQQGIAAAERDAAAAAGERVEHLRRQLAAAERDAETATRERIRGLRAQLAAAERDGDVFGREGVAPNPLREALSRDLVAARARLKSLASQRDALRGQLPSARAALTALQEKRVHGGRITREIEFARAVHLQNSKRLDDARIAAGLRRHQLTNVAVIEPPQVGSTGAGRRNVVLAALLGGVVGLGLGVATALALEFWNWSLRTPEDVEFYLGVPVLATVPVLVSGAPYRPAALPAAGERPPTPGTPGPSRPANG